MIAFWVAANMAPSNKFKIQNIKVNVLEPGLRLICLNPCKVNNCEVPKLISIKAASYRIQLNFKGQEFTGNGLRLPGLNPCKVDNW
jgi:hypothetical protein